VCSSEDGLHWLPTIPNVVDEVQSRDADTVEAQGSVGVPANMVLGKRRANMDAFAAGDGTEVQTDSPWALLCDCAMRCDACHRSQPLPFC
jgi:hypothetical protein